jgi:type IV secretory pathway protease TraF
MVVVRPSATLEDLLANHDVLPHGMPLLKYVIAVGRDQICRSARVVYVNGTVAAEALDHDREGRPLPFRQGVRAALRRPFLRRPTPPYSFDSRYFRPVSDCQIIGVAPPLWTWNPPQ